MNEHLRERILRKLDALSDERGYQVLDYVEFLESKFAERRNPENAFTRFSDAVEDRLRAGKVSASAIAETMGLLNRAANVLNGAVAAGKSVASDIYGVATGVAGVGGPPTRPSGSTTGSGGSSGTTGATGPTGASGAAPTPNASPSGKEASSPAHDVKKPGSGEEHL